MSTIDCQFHLSQHPNVLTAPNSSEVAVFLMSKEELSIGQWFHPQLDDEIKSLQERGIFQAKKHQVQLIPTMKLIPFSYILLIGIGNGEASDNTVRDGAIVAARTALKHKLLNLVFEVKGTDAVSKVKLLTEGLMLGSYHLPTYAYGTKPYDTLRNVTYILSNTNEEDLDALNLAVELGKVYAESTNIARDLTNLPGNLLTPQLLAEEAERIAKLHTLPCEVHDEIAIEQLKMGGLHAVGKGSVHPPRMIVMKYQGLSEWNNVLGLVGKGVTFDTGGISIKSGEGMEEMISDMGGAATVLGVMHALGKLKPKVNVVAVIPAAENMPSGNAFKPGDIISSLSGKTIEVLNTDAEGRIVLADGMTYAKQLGAEKLIDVATLTGAILVAFGDVTTGAVTNDETFLQELILASKQAGEKVWPLPNDPEYAELIKSDVADIKNASGKWAASITAGLFIGTFAEGTPWIHLDTGGTAWLWKESKTEPKGATGSMVRTLIQMITT